MRTSDDPGRADFADVERIVAGKLAELANAAKLHAANNGNVVVAGNLASSLSLALCGQ